ADAQPCEASAECQPETDAEADPCSVHECEGGRCVVRPPRTQTGCWAPFSDGSKRIGLCAKEAPFCNPCWGPYEWSPGQTCRSNPACCWATHDDFAWPTMRCFGSCVDGLCVQPDGGCEMWY
ncbi:MAG: hypothetical protein IT376_00885, partial [Polyangiaceae bacterium]|nr:hypothetical protein [Polyangiaceae bacterium]